MRPWDKKVRQSSMVLAFCVALLLGLLVARKYATLPAWFLWLSGVASLVTIRRKTQLAMALLFIFGLGLGLARGADYMTKMAPYSSNTGQKVTVQGRVNVDAVYGDKGQLSFAVDDVRFIVPAESSAPGTMKIKGYGELAIYKGDIVEVTGKMYKTRGASQASISYAKITRVGSHTSFADTVRRSFIAGMQTALPEPLASFGLGLLVGQRNTLPAEYSQALMMVGLTHIVAVSGYNLTILLEATKRIMGGRSKQLSVAVGFALMIGFLFLTGASASIVRASVISTLSLAAWYFGRSVRPMVLILLAAALTAMFSPIYLWSDIGWYLSFLAFFGILMVAPKILSLLYAGRQAPLIIQVAVETLAAEIMTLPLILYIFGQMSFIGILANVLVVSMIPFAMLTSLIAGLAGMFLPLASGLFALPARFILTYMLDTALFLSRLPNVFKTGAYLSVWDMALLYGLIGVATYALHRTRKSWFEKISVVKQHATKDANQDASKVDNKTEH